MIVVTTFSEKGYRVYGKQFVESFVANWPDDVRLYAYYEGERPEGDSSRVKWVSLDADRDRARFMAEHKDIEDTPGDYRFRVVRYSHKVWAQTSAPREDYLLWLDADCVTVNKVTHDMIQKVLPPAGKVAAFLHRPYFRHTETGFIAYGINAGGGEFLDEFRRLYTTGDICNLPEWHDCAGFDFVRRQFERAGYRFHNLCPGATGLEVFEQSPLATFVQHNKGPKRKEKAYGDPMLSMEEA